MFIKFDSTVGNVCGKICSPRSEISDINPDQQLLFFFNPSYSQCLFTVSHQIRMCKIEKHLSQVDLLKVYITQASQTRVKIQECYIQLFYE